MSKQKKRSKKSKGPSIRKDLREEAFSQTVAPMWYKKVSWPIVLLLCVVTFFSLVHGSNYKRREGFLTFDESIYVRLGMYLKQGKPYNTQEIYDSQKKKRIVPEYVNRPVFKHPPMYPWLISMFYSALEQKSAYSYEELYGAASKVSNMMGCLLILLVFMFGKRYYGYSTGFLAALLMAIDLNMTLSSQKVWMESTLCFFIFATLYLLYKACEEHKGYFYAAGVTFGLAMLTKYPAVLVVPILMTYIMIYHRSLLKEKELYIFFAIAALIFAPWLKHNMDAYGMGALKMMILKQTAGPGKIWRFFGFGIVLLGGFIGTIFIQKLQSRKQESSQAETINIWPTVGMIVMTCAVAYLVLQKPFLTSILKTLSWGELPTSGWKMQMFVQEPWYFYLKQHIEYSPFYLMLLIAFLRAPIGQRQDVFMLLCFVWIFIFVIFWGNFQGRYALSFVPPAIILIASTITLMVKMDLNQRNTWGYVSLGIMILTLSYFLFKALKVYSAIALNDNVAYF